MNNLDTYYYTQGNGAKTRVRKFFIKPTPNGGRVVNPNGDNPGPEYRSRFDQTELAGMAQTPQAALQQLQEKNTAEIKRLERQLAEYRASQAGLAARISSGQQKRQAKHELIPNASYWKLVAELDWPSVCHQPDTRDKQAREFYQKHGRETCDAFINTTREKVTALHNAINTYEAQTGKSTGLGDDGFSDLIHHIVGLGQKTYDATLKNPRLAIDRAKQGEFKESFAYMLLWEHRR